MTTQEPTKVTWCFSQLVSVRQVSWMGCVTFWPLCKRSNDRIILKHRFRRLWKKPVVVYFKLKLHIYLDGLRKLHKSQKSSLQSWIQRYKYKAWNLTTQMIDYEEFWAVFATVMTFLNNAFFLHWNKTGDQCESVCVRATNFNIVICLQRYK